MKKKCFDLADIFKYSKLKLGYAAVSHQSPYEVACKALEKDGMPRPLGATWKQWVDDCEQHILWSVAGLTKAVVSRKLPKTSNKKLKPVEPAKGKVQAPSSKVDPIADDFLWSYEWRSLRMVAIKKYGPVCQCCGASPRTGAVINVDHIKPRKLFPELALEIDNLQILCSDCNHGKGNWDSTDWRTT